MLAVISPAKKLKFDGRDPVLKATAPGFLSEANKLARTAKKLSRADLRQMMKISDALADLNYRRFQDFKAKPDETATKHAVLAFAGDTYTGLDAESFTPHDLDFAQAHLRILSGLYGVLRPLDEIQPYRLEMGRKIKTERGNSLYDYWGGRIAKALDKDLAGQDEKVVINLASHEYFKAVQSKILKARVIDMVFKEGKNGEYKIIGLMAKRARGAMARYMILNRLTNPEDLKDFNEDGYKFQKSQSDENSWLFTRG